MSNHKNIRPKQVSSFDIVLPTLTFSPWWGAVPISPLSLFLSVSFSLPGILFSFSPPSLLLSACCSSDTSAQQHQQHTLPTAWHHLPVLLLDEVSGRVSPSLWRTGVLTLCALLQVSMQNIGRVFSNTRCRWQKEYKNTDYNLIYYSIKNYCTIILRNISNNNATKAKTKLHITF